MRRGENGSARYSNRFSLLLFGILQDSDYEKRLSVDLSFVDFLHAAVAAALRYQFPSCEKTFLFSPLLTHEPILSAALTLFVIWCPSTGAECVAVSLFT
jgi:hypothetical protein